MADMNKKMDEQKTVKVKKGRKVWKWVAGILVFLVAVVWLLPYVISSGWGTNLVVSQVNKRIPQQVAVKDISLRWLGPCEVEGVEVSKVEGLEKVQVERVHWTKGLLNGFGADLGTIEVERPYAVVLLGTEKAKEEKKKEEKPAEKKGEMAKLSATVRVKDGAVVLVQPDRRQYTVSKIEGDIAIRELDEIKGTLSLELDRKERVRGQVQVQGVQSGKPTGEVTLVTDDPVQLETVSKFASAGAGVKGLGNLDVKVEFMGEDVQAAFTTKVMGLQSEQVSQEELKPIDVVLDGQAAKVKNQITGKVNLQSEAAKLASELAYVMPEEGAAPAGTDLQAMLLAGKDVKLPDFLLKTSGQIDLPALAQAVPTLLKVRPGLVIEKGSIEIRDLTAQGGTAPGITGKIELKDLQAKEGDKEIKFAPVLSEIDAAVEPGVGLKVRQAQVQSDFLTLQAGGTMTSLQADFQTNLDQLYNQLNQLLVLGEFKVAGNLSGKLGMNKVSEEKVEYDLSLAGDQIQYQASAGKEMKWEKIRSQEKGYFLLAENAVQKVALEEMNLDVDGALAVNGSGWYQLTDGSFEGQVKVPQAQLGTLSAWAGGPALSGQGGLEAQVKSKGPEDLSLVFQSRVTGLRSEQVAQEELKPIDVALDGQVAMAGKKIDGKVNVKSAAAEIASELAYALPEKPLTLRGEDVTAMLLTGKMAELPEASARINGQVNLPALAEAVPTLLKVRPGLAIQGGSIRIQDLAVQGGKAPQVTGKIELKDLKAQEGDKVLAFEPVVADMDVAVEEKVGLKIRKTQVQSNFMTLQAAGTMTGLQAEFQSNLDKLYSQLSQLVVLGDFKAAGNLSGKLGMNKMSDEKVEYDFSLAGDQVQYQSGTDQQLQVAKLRMQKKGYLVLAKNTIEKVILSELDLDADGVLKMTGEGWYQVGDKSFEGKVSIPEAQLASLAKWGKGMGVKDLERYEGGVALEMNFQKSQPEQVVKTNGQAKVRNLRIDQKEVIESGEDITLQWSGIDCGQETVTVENVKLASPLLSAEMGGKVADYKKSCQLDLAGKYEGSWNRIMTLVHLLQPDLREQVVIQGTTGSDIRIQGPARVAEADPAFRGVQGTMEAGWQSAKLYGMNFAQAKLAPRLENGQVIIPETIILSEGGQVRLKGTIDLAGKEADFQLEEVTQVLDNLKLTEAMVQMGLSRINPIFANMAKTEGAVSLSMQGVNLPLSKEILKTGKGQGRLDLSNLKVEPSGILKELLTLAGVSSEGIQSAKSRGVDFVIDQGRLKYDNFVLSFGEQYEMKFYGWVGFDDTVDMVVSLPVRAALLERFGVNSASATEYAGVLEGVSLDIPLVGTRTSPKLAMSQVDMKPLIEKATKGLMKEKGTDLLKNLLKKKEEDKKPEKSSEEKKAEEKKAEEKKEVKKETKKEKAKTKAAEKKANEEAKKELQSQPKAVEEKAPSTATEPPAAPQPPAGTEPPATTQPPAAAEPPAATAPPAASEPPAAAQPPAATEPPANSQPPAASEPPATTEPPASSQPPAASEPPASSTPPATTEPPATNEPPAATEPPATNEPPAAAQPPVENK